MAEITVAWFRKCQASLRKVLDRSQLSAAERLQAVVLQGLRSTQELFTQHEKIGDGREFISRERFDLIEQHKDVKRAMLAEILAEGNRHGEFAEADVIGAADLILKATFIFEYPGCVNLFSAGEFERLAKGVVQMLIAGIGKLQQ